MARIAWKRCSLIVHGMRRLETLLFKSTLLVHGMRRLETLHLIRSFPSNSTLFLCFSRGEKNF